MINKTVKARIRSGEFTSQDVSVLLYLAEKAHRYSEDLKRELKKKEAELKAHLAKEVLKVPASKQYTSDKNGKIRIGKDDFYVRFKNKTFVITGYVLMDTQDFSRTMADKKHKTEEEQEHKKTRKPKEKYTAIRYINGPNQLSPVDVDGSILPEADRRPRRRRPKHPVSSPQG